MQICVTLLKQSAYYGDFICPEKPITYDKAT